jgi:hypothetical protein
MKTGTLKKNGIFRMFFAFFDSTESGFGSDIFDVGATDFTRHSSTIERVRMNDLSFNRFNGRVSLGIF